MHNELVRRLRDYHLLGIHDWDVYLAAADLIEQQAEELRSAKIMCDSYVAENQRFFDEANVLHRDNAALMADGAEQARLAKEACERAALFRALLDDMTKEFVRVFPIYYYAEPWAHDRNVSLKTALAALAQKEG